MALNENVIFVSRTLIYSITALSAFVFGTYAAKNTRYQWLEPGSRRWVYLALAGGAGALYGGFGIVGSMDVVLLAELSLPLQYGAAIFVTLFLAFAVRETYFNGLYAPAPTERLMTGTSFQHFEMGLFGLVVVAWWTTFFTDFGSTALQLVGIVGLLAFAGYGLTFGTLIVSRARGSSLDTLLRHVLPALGCFGIIGIVRALGVAGIEQAVVIGTTDVFSVVAATFLFTAAIGLKQNVERHEFTEFDG